MPEVADQMEQAPEQGQGGGGSRRGSGQGGGERGRGALQAFLRDLAQDLEDMLEGADFLSPDARVLAILAYADGPRAEVSRMIESLDSPTVEGALERHGLLGVQLQFKLQVHALSRRVYRGPIVMDIAVEQDAQGAADQAAEEYLKCSDIILESLSSALGGVGAALIEFKKMIEWLKGLAARFGFRL
jgi:hypothetical protein